jgi:hypothetical protein
VPPAFFTLSEDRFVPHEDARSWWTPGMLSGPLLGGLLARALETAHGDPEFQFSRLTVDLFRNCPFEPVRITTEVIREGRRIRVTEAKIVTSIGVVARASGVQLRRGEQPPGPVPTRTPEWDAPDPEGITDPYFSFVPDGDHSRRGMWIRADRPLVAGEELSPFVRVALAADEGSPVAHRGETELEFINADYTLTLSRDPIGEFIGLSAGGHVSRDGIAVGHATVHDEKGPIGFSRSTAVANVRTV